MDNSAQERNSNLLKFSQQQVVLPTGSNITEDQWQAIIQNNMSYDRHFYYGVKTTKIFCRPSCKSRVPNRENVKIFQDTQQALSESFRPCKRCKPLDLQLPSEEWIEQVVHYIDANYSEHLTLQTLAELCHGSPYHLQRTFKKITGLTPTEYIQKVRINKAIEYLTTSDMSITEIAITVGITNMSYFVTLFKQKIGHTPLGYRRFKNAKEA
ncbi:TPA: bifunctional transcriptional activator/DNA repair enzyme AdaA [Bacillus cereus]